MALSVSVISACGGNSDNGFPSDKGFTPPEAETSVPVAFLVEIDGQPVTGQTLTGTYLFIDQNIPARNEGASILRWISQLTGEQVSTGNNLVIGSELLGDQVAFCVTPVAEGTVNTTGEEQCSLFTPVIVSNTGSPPEAQGVLVNPDTGLVVGSTVNGQYTYFDIDGDAESNSQFEWRANGDTIPGEVGLTFTPTAAAEGMTLVFCVTPQSVKTTPETPTQGTRVCSEATAGVNPLPGSAPEADNVDASGGITAPGTITGRYDYNDADGDAEAASTFRWLADGAEVSGFTNITYNTGDDDIGKTIEFCVTPAAATGAPKVGIEACSAPFGPIEAPEPAPIATASIDGIPFQLRTLTGSYVYDSNGGANEGVSIIIWRIGNKTASGNTYTLVLDDIGKTIEYCVTPVSATAVSGAEDCASVTGTGIRMIGLLEYSGPLEVTSITGLTGATSWEVDTSNVDGPFGNDSPSLAPGPFNSNIYVIGNRFLAFAEGQVTDTNQNGTIDDYDWKAAINRGTAPEINAQQFIGKEVYFCVTDATYGKLCAEASREPDVFGGIYFDDTDPSRRGIDPQRFILLRADAGDVLFHRPLTLQETKLKDQVGLRRKHPRGVGFLRSKRIELGSLYPWLAGH